MSNQLELFIVLDLATTHIGLRCHLLAIYLYQHLS